MFVVLTLMASPVFGGEMIRSPAELNAACAENRCGVPFEIAGTVVIPPNVPRADIVLLSENALISVVDMRTDPGEGTPHILRIGDRVIARGQTEPYPPKRLTTANCRTLKVVAAGSLPDITPMRLRDFNPDDEIGNRIVALRGTIQDVFPDDIDDNNICAVLKDGESYANLTCCCPRSWLPDFRALLGCDVIVTGICSRRGRSKPRFLGLRLSIAGTNAFRVVSRPVGYPFNAPEFSADDAENPYALAKLGPQIVRGTVLATWGRDSFLIRTAADKAVRINLSEGRLPPTRTAVEAVGIVETDLCDLTLSRASWRPVDDPMVGEDKAERTALKSLFTSGRLHYPSINVNAHGKTLTVCGTIKSISYDTDGSRKLLLADGEHTILVVCGPNAAGDPPPEEGWRVTVTGVCVKDSDVWRPTVPIPKIRGLFLVTRSNADFAILRKTPWWTPARLAMAIAVLLAVLVAIFIWNVTLRILIDRRSREVVRAQTAKIASELRIDERTRLAADLHDNTVQNLTAIAYRITAAQGALGDREPEAGRILQVAAKMLKSCRTSLRQCLWDLRNDALNEPDFETAIRKTVETVAGDAKLSIRFAGRRDLVNDSHAHAILNILRELVSNATVHGAASSVGIAGEARPGFIRFSVRDDGIGFDPTQRPGQDDGHFGLDGITERLESLGGTLDIESAPGRGSYIRITISSAASNPQLLNISTSQPEHESNPHSHR